MQAVLKLASHVCAVTGNRTMANREMKRPRPVLQPETQKREIPSLFSGRHGHRRRVDRGGTARLRLAWAMNNRAISPKGSAYVYVIGHEKREKCNSIVRIRLVLLLALNGNSLSGAEIVSCWGYNCRRGNPTKRRPARNILTRTLK